MANLLGDPKLLSFGILISNLIACRTSSITGMHATEQAVAAKDIISEINRRFPNDFVIREKAASALDTVEGAIPPVGKTENFPTESGYYLAQFVGPLEVVFYNHDRKMVLRIDGSVSFDNAKRTYKVHEFKWLQKVKFHPGLDFNCQPTELSKEAAMNARHEQSPAEIQVDFEKVWHSLAPAIVYAVSEEIREKLQYVQGLFQNPAVIIPKD